MNAFGSAHNIIVLGGDSAIARSTVDALHTADPRCRVVLCVRDPHRVPAAPGVVARLAYDAAVGDGVADVLAAAAQTLGSVDTVIVAAGVLPPEGIDVPLDAVARTARVNFEGAICAIHAARALLAGEGGGTIVLISSVAAVRVRPAMPVYGASKHGVDAYLRASIAGVRGRGIGGIVVRPGFVTTPMTAHLPTPRGANTPEQVGSVIVAALARVRPGRCAVVYVNPLHRVIAAILRALPIGVLARLSR